MFRLFRILNIKVKNIPEGIEIFVSGKIQNLKRALTLLLVNTDIYSYSASNSHILS
jgi:ABC-type metal ion transport system substrate-binding protein